MCGATRDVCFGPIGELQGKEETAVTATLYRFPRPDSAYERKVKWSRGIKMRLVGCRIAEVECELIIETLADQHGSRTKAAKLLGISLRTLRNKIHEYGGRGKTIPKPGFH